MVKCPYCGSSAQVRKYGWDIHFVNDNEVIIYRDYKCGCGEYFGTEQTYIAQGCEQIEEEEGE